VKSDLTPLFFCFLVFLFIQMVPLPQGLLLVLSPEAKINGDMSLPAASILDGASLKGQWYALAAYLHPVRMSLIRWIVYGLFLFGLIRCLNSRQRIETAVVAILALGVFDALYGIMQTYSGHGHVWWYKDPQHFREVSGTYLNRNHFAGLMEMGIALAVAYAAALGDRPEEGQGGRGGRQPFRKRFLAFFSEGRRDIRRVLIVFAGGVMGLGLILSASRGGIIATAAALFLMGILFVFRKDEQRKGRLILALCGIALFYGLYAGLDNTIGRFELFDQDMKNRNIMTDRAIDVFREYRAFGVGLGNFRHVSGRFQDAIHQNLYFDYAHNDYAQFLAEAGIVGALLLIGGMAFYAARTFRLWRRRSDPFALGLGIAPFAALTALGIHSWSDFNLHRPANMMVLIAVIAIGNAALRLEGRGQERSSQDERPIPLRRRGMALLACGVGLILWAGLWSVRHFVAESHCNTGINITLNLDEAPPADEARAAMAWDPANAGYPYKLALALMAERDRLMQQTEPDMAGWRRSHGPIIALLERAIRLNPLNADYHVRLGWEYTYLWDRPDHLARWLPAGDLCLERAAWFAGSWPQNPRLQYDMGNYWTMRAKTLGPGSPQSDVAWTKALWHYRKGLELEKQKKLPDFVQAYVRNFFTDKALPDK
jgi:O-antigen ligase